MSDFFEAIFNAEEISEYESLHENKEKDRRIFLQACFCADSDELRRAYMKRRDDFLSMIKSGEEIFDYYDNDVLGSVDIGIKRLIAVLDEDDSKKFFKKK